MAVIPEARDSARFGFVGIDRECVVVASAWMGDVVSTTADRTTIPAIHQIEHKRRLHADGRVQTGRRAPSTVAHTSDIFATDAGGSQRQRTATGIRGEYE